MASNLKSSVSSKPCCLLYKISRVWWDMTSLVLAAWTLFMGTVVCELVMRVCLKPRLVNRLVGKVRAASTHAAPWLTAFICYSHPFVCVAQTTHSALTGTFHVLNANAFLYIQAPHVRVFRQYYGDLISVVELLAGQCVKTLGSVQSRFQLLVCTCTLGAGVAVSWRWVPCWDLSACTWWPELLWQQTARRKGRPGRLL